MVIELVACNVLFLNDVVTANPQAFPVLQDLTFIEVVEINLKQQRVRSTLYMIQSVECIKILNFDISESLVFSESNHHRAFVEDVGNIMVMGNTMLYGPLLPLASQFLNLQEEIICYACKATFDTFTMTDVADCVKIYAPQVQQSLVMASTCTTYKPDKNWLNGNFTVEA